jgi:hypothetical protein
MSFKYTDTVATGEKGALRSRFVEPPFTVLDSKNKYWKDRKAHWLAMGIQSEVGRDAKAFNTTGTFAGKTVKTTGVSIFDPVLAELAYTWFCPVGGSILDPFAGGSVRGIVANHLGYKYTGIDIRQEQVDSNRDQALDILPMTQQPAWYVGDSAEVLASGWDLIFTFDFIFSCPPYAYLEKYSDLPGDISNMDYHTFMDAYREIIALSVELLAPGGYACFVVGEIRDREGYCYGFVPDTIRAFEDVGCRLYNDAVLLNAIGTAPMRANGNMKSQKLVKTHQNVLVFKKPG